LEADLPKVSPAPIEEDVAEPPEGAGDGPWIVPFPTKAGAA
jgi:hypothetical protein